MFRSRRRSCRYWRSGTSTKAITETGEDRNATDAILAYMVRQDDGPWAEWWSEKVDAGKTVGPARRLRRYLERFEGVTPKRYRTGELVVRGYELAPVLEAVNRYLPHLSVTPGTSATPLARTVAAVTGVTDTPSERDQARLRRPDGHDPGMEPART